MKGIRVRRFQKYTLLVRFTGVASYALHYFRLGNVYFCTVFVFYFARVVNRVRFHGTLRFTRNVSRIA